jgi:uncharacterized membrane protein SirB2
MNSYLALKHLHITCVVLSGSFFALRFYWRMQAAEYLQKKWVKILPHCLDTLLLISAISMAILVQLNPFIHSWLLMKIIMLIAYIVCGSFAIKYARTKRNQILSFIGASLCFFAIVWLAISKQILPFLQFI